MVYEKQQKLDQAINSYESLLARNLFTSAVRNNLAFLMAEPWPEARREPEGSGGGSCGIFRQYILSLEVGLPEPEAPQGHLL